MEAQEPRGRSFTFLERTSISYILWTMYFLRLCGAESRTKALLNSYARVDFNR